MAMRAEFGLCPFFESQLGLYTVLILKSGNLIVIDAEELQRAHFAFNAFDCLQQCSFCKYLAPILIKLQ